MTGLSWLLHLEPSSEPSPTFVTLGEFQSPCSAAMTYSKSDRHCPPLIVSLHLSKVPLHRPCNYNPSVIRSASTRLSHPKINVHRERVLSEHIPLCLTQLQRFFWSVYVTQHGTAVAVTGGVFSGTPIVGNWNQTVYTNNNRHSSTPIEGASLWWS
jgi:hypothetical protein